MTDKKFSLNKQFGTNKAKEEEGVKHDLGDGAWIQVRRANSEAAKAVLKRLQKPYAKMARVPDHVGEDIVNKFLAQGVIVAWGGMQLDGQDLGEYTADKGMKVITHAEVGKDFREFVSGLAQAADVFKDEDTEEAAKN